MSRPFCPPFGQIFRHFGNGWSSSTSLYLIGCKRHSCMFTCSVDEGGCKRHSDSCLAFKYGWLYTTHRYRRCVLKVWSYGKCRTKKKWKMCHLFLSGTKKILSSACLWANLLPAFPAVVAEFCTAFPSYIWSTISKCLLLPGCGRYRVRLRQRRYDKKEID